MSELLDADVAVIGAGPAGSAAATTLARAGLDVVLADRARFPRDKCCGDGLTTGALRRLDDLGLDPAVVSSFNTVEDLSVRSPSGRVVRVPLAGGRASPTRGVRGAVAKRKDLDAALLEVARSAGANVLEGQSFVDFDGIAAAARGDGRIGLRLGEDTVVRTRYVIAADGAWSPVRRALGERDAGAADTRDWHAFRTYATGVQPEAAKHLWVLFDECLLPGYGWSFPLGGGGANVGICLRLPPRPSIGSRGFNGEVRAIGDDPARESRAESSPSKGRELARAWEAFVSSAFVSSLLGRNAELELPARSWPIPAGISPPRLSALGGRVLFVGDAASAADPFTGEGIGQAIETGVAAAQSIAEGGRRSASSEEVGRAYIWALGETLAPDHRLARLCTSLMGRPLAARGAVRVTGLTPWLNRQVGRWLYEDFPRSLVLAPWRWRPGTLARPAAYR